MSTTGYAGGTLARAACHTRWGKRTMSGRPHTRYALLAAAVLGAGAIACERSTAPGVVAAEYALVMLAEQPLPAAPGAGSDVRILSDTIRLRDDGSGTRVHWYRIGDDPTVHVSRDELSWTVDGSTISVALVCDDTRLAVCIAPPHLAGALGPGLQWVIPQARIYGDVPAVYQRVGMR